MVFYLSYKKRSDGWNGEMVMLIQLVMVGSI